MTMNREELIIMLAVLAVGTAVIILLVISGS
jgi:hypothetical protein